MGWEHRGDILEVGTLELNSEGSLDLSPKAERQRRVKDQYASLTQGGG